MKLKLVTFLAASSLTLLSCSNEYNVEVDEIEHVDRISSCIDEFKVDFADEVEKLRSIKTRSIEIDNDEYDLLVDSVGNVIIADLLPASSQLMSELGLKETDFTEIEKEYGIPSDFMKVYLAMGIMEVSESPNTRASLEEAVGCAIFGAGYKTFIEGGAKVVLRKCAQQAAKKLIPYIGWGWWAAETAACLARL